MIWPLATRLLTRLPAVGRIGIVVILLAATAFGVSRYGAHRYQAGVVVERAAWETKQIEAQKQARADLAIVEKRHAQEQGKIAGQLAAVEQRADADVRRAATVAADRLRRSEARADLYQRQAASGAAAAGDLARHAAELDRQLAEGVGVVEELGALVEQRDAQLTLLGKQIMVDRAAVEAWGE